MPLETRVQGTLKVQLFLKPLGKEADFVPCERIGRQAIVIQHRRPATDFWQRSYTARAKSYPACIYVLSVIAMNRYCA